jgi:transcriptional regulator with XRE-family HTH domain
MAKNMADIIASKTKIALGSSLISLEAIKQNIQVLDELRDFIPPLNQEEYGQLEQNIINYGCKDAILIWETTKEKIGQEGSPEPLYLIIDGHNRYGICKKHGITFNIQLLQFSGIKEVKDFMIETQLGRRNLTPQQASFFRGLRYNNEKTEKGKYDRDEHKVQNEPYATTAQKLAKEYNVSESTIKRDAAFAKGLVKLDDSLRNQILKGEKNIDKQILERLAKLQNTIHDISDLDVLETPTLEPMSKKELDKHIASLLNETKSLAKNLDKVHLFEIKKIIKLIESNI